MTEESHSVRIDLIRADITSMRVEAIVNAANSRLQHGGGVAAAISTAGGPGIQAESNAIGNVPTGSAAVTSGGNLLCRYVIHAVGPQMGEGDEDRKLRDATIASLDRAEELKIRSIAFPAISTGIFGFPMERCAQIMLAAVMAYPAKSIDRVVFCLFGQEAFDLFQKTWEGLQSER